MKLSTMFSKKTEATAEIKNKTNAGAYSTVSGHYNFMGIQVWHMKSPIGDAHKGYTAIVSNRWVFGNTTAEIEFEIKRTLKEFPMVQVS